MFKCMVINSQLELPKESVLFMFVRNLSYLTQVF